MPRTSIAAPTAKRQRTRTLLSPDAPRKHSVPSPDDPDRAKLIAIVEERGPPIDRVNGMQADRRWSAKALAYIEAEHTGYILKHVRALGARHIPEEDLVQAAKIGALRALETFNLDKAGLRHCSVRLADMYTLPIPDRSIDHVVIHQVLHYSERPDQATAEAARTLAPGGRLAIVDFAPHDLEELRQDRVDRGVGVGLELALTEDPVHGGLDVLLSARGHRAQGGEAQLPARELVPALGRGA